MKAVVQRVSQASVSIDGKVVGAIQQGIVALLGICANDTPDLCEKMAHKLANLRIFSDDAGKMNISVLDIRGKILIIPNFTLCGDVQKGFRPSFIGAAHPSYAKELYEKTLQLLSTKYNIPVQTGIFGADMQCSLINDGPVTILVEIQAQ